MGHEPSALAGRTFLDFPRTQSLNPLFQPHRPARAGKTMRQRSMANGRLAQLVEHCVHIAGVTGSSPVPPTITTSCFDSTLGKGLAPHQLVEISAVTARSQQEVSHGDHPQARSDVASSNPKGRRQSNFALVPCAQRRRSLGSPKRPRGSATLSSRARAALRRSWIVCFLKQKKPRHKGKASPFPQDPHIRMRPPDVPKMAKLGLHTLTHNKKLTVLLLGYSACCKAVPGATNITKNC
jgi:hypothetical protein